MICFPRKFLVPFIFHGPDETEQVACVCEHRWRKPGAEMCMQRSDWAANALSLCLPGQIFIFLQPPSCQPAARPADWLAALFKNARPWFNAQRLVLHLSRAALVREHKFLSRSLARAATWKVEPRDQRKSKLSAKVGVWSVTLWCISLPLWRLFLMTPLGSEA